MKTKKFKNVVYWTCAVLLIGWVVFRFAAIGAENSRAVFNTARYSADEGAPVFATSVHKESGVLKEPIAVKNNTALVSTYRVDKLKAGQRVGKGKIISVSKVMMACNMQNLKQLVFLSHYTQLMTVL